MVKNTLIVCDTDFGGIFNYAKPLYEKLKNNINVDFYYRKGGLLNRILYYTNLIKKINSGKYKNVDIQALTWPITLLIIFIKKMNNSFKFIFDSHDDPLTSRTKYRPIFTRKYILKNSDIIVVHSKYNESIVNSLGFNNTFYIPLGPYMENPKIISQNKAKSKIKVKKYEKMLLFFGIITPDKGLDVILNSMKIITDKEKNILLFIVGPIKKNWMDWDYYENMIKKLNIEKFIKTKLKYTQLNELSQYICASDIIVMPYKEITNSSVPFVAYQFKKPIIATNVGGMNEIVINNKTGILVERENEIELAKSILKLINNKKKMKILGENGFKILNTKFSWNTILEKYKLILK